MIAFFTGVDPREGTSTAGHSQPLLRLRGNGRSRAGRRRSTASSRALRARDDGACTAAPREPTSAQPEEPGRHSGTAEPQAVPVAALPRFAPDESAAIGRVLERAGYAACIYCHQRLSVFDADGLLKFVCPGCGRTGSRRAVLTTDGR